MTRHALTLFAAVLIASPVVIVLVLGTNHG